MKNHITFLALPIILGGAFSIICAATAFGALEAKRASTYAFGGEAHPGGIVLAQTETAGRVTRRQELALAVQAEQDVEAAGDARLEKPKPRKEVIIKAIEPSSEWRLLDRETPWLGVSTEETTEALAAQLGLENGAGLTVTYIAPESPAAKAGLKKNDVLVKFEDQFLVHPAQFRKLVRSRKEGDSVQVVYYRAGKKETANMTVGKSKPLFGWDAENGWEGNLSDLKRQLGELPIRPKIEENLRGLRESMGNWKIDQQKAQEDLKRSLVEAQKELERAMAQIPHVTAGLDPARKALKELEWSRLFKDNNASITVRSSGDSVKSLVRSDESGTLVIVANPNPRLTAHDKEGKLIFDGEIQSQEQRDKVPRDLWERVEPLLDKMNSTPKDADQE